MIVINVIMTIRMEDKTPQDSIELIPNHDHLTRFSVGDNLNLPQLNKSVSQKQFFYNAILNWNRLPPHLTNLNVRKLKNELRKWLVIK